MLKKVYGLLLFTSLSSVAFFSIHCGNESKLPVSDTTSVAPSTYLNHADSVNYVGMNACKQCHASIYETFIQTGMGKSFDLTTKPKSSAKFDKHTTVYDKYLDFYYHPYWEGDSMKIMEFRLNGMDTIFKRIETVTYIIGSGQHTNSHINNTNGYLRQLPLTFYTQKGTWDLPPGFENGFNTRFNRKIGLECMSCHNSLPGLTEGSENKFSDVPNGISCERCHGPGSAHVKEKTAGHLIDTSKYIDYSIVNPGKLPIDLQFDVCQRCHLQGNAVLNDNKSFFDFKPGKKLSDYLTVFMPKYKDAEDEFIMASHADRLKMSECFIKSFSPTDASNKLHPYKQALTCVTCHNPHLSVKFTDKEVFNTSCQNCHSNQKNKTVCTEKEFARKKQSNNCVACHMPKSGAIDIPHVRVTDHYIRKPIASKEAKNVKQFIGLYAINDPNPKKGTIALAYIYQYEKFDFNPTYLDSAQKYLDDKTLANIEANFSSLVHLYFAKKEYAKILSYVSKLGETKILTSMLIKKSWDNKQAWTAYRIGEAYYTNSNFSVALKYYKKANELAISNPEFQNKLASTYSQLGNIQDAKNIFYDILKEDPTFVPAISNLGYICLLENNTKQAAILFNRALRLDPDYELALMNKAGLLIYGNNKKEAKKLIEKVLKKNPKNEKAKEIIKSL